ncbi:hypothetical protein ACN4EK_32075 [Pantanalinema rosaneae CENA516]|uniref:hypothetical protein n=1 Tax=Pantanalinema rosaneae TaxID=1620701 RepID=UPI003D6E9A92
MTEPLFWLVLSLLFVTISLTIVLVVAIPTLLELGRAARSAEKLFDTLRREFPPTLEAIRLTGLEISDLTDDVSQGVQSANQVVQQVDQSLSGVRQQARKVHVGTRNVMTGIKAAWKTFTKPQPSVSPRRSVDRLPPGRLEPEMDALREQPNSHRMLEGLPYPQDAGVVTNQSAVDPDELPARSSSPAKPMSDSDPRYLTASGRDDTTIEDSPEDGSYWER